jgi:hypothetical protein
VAVTIPDNVFTVATAALLLLQLPPASPSLLYAAIAPMQSGEVPFTAPGFTFGLTVINIEADAGLAQPLLMV